MISDTQVMPLKLQIDYDSFVTIYQQANLLQTDETVTKLIKALQFAFLDWQEAWVSKNYISNINISSLIRILIKDDSPRGEINWKIDTYNEYLKLNQLTLVDELTYCLIQHVRKDKKIYNRYHQPKNLLFFIAKDIKMFLFKKIRKVLANYRRCGDFKISYKIPTVGYDLIFDHEYLKNNPLHNNVLVLLLQELNVSQITSILQITKKTYKEVIACLLQNLKQLSK